MELTMLGTGNAQATECYNTCFVLGEEKRYLMVDGGGGNTVLSRLKACGLDWKDMRHIFVTHKHIDHILGMVWMMRMITQNMHQGQYEGEAYIYGHEEVIALLEDMARKLLQKKTLGYIGERLHLVTLEDGQEFEAAGWKLQAFDIHSTKAKQFGFTMQYGDGRRLTCCGDEPYTDSELAYAQDADWLLHEAFCLHSEAGPFHPYEKHHSTVKDACELAEKLRVRNLVLYHTEDKNLANRKRLYTEEGARYYSGKLWVPDDLETIVL